MAEIIPSLENIERLKVSPTPGEMALATFLAQRLSDEYEIFFHPFLNGDMPDIILMRRGAGVAIVEVKDWKLSSYIVDDKNQWRERAGNHVIRSPFRQAFGYKSNMFNLHINGLAEKNALNNNFYGIIKPFVYFHESTKDDANELYHPAESSLRQARDELNQSFRNHEIPHAAYEKRLGYIDQKFRQISRDKGMSIFPNDLSKITNCLKQNHVLFTDQIHDEFLRYLKPPYHVERQGKNIDYDARQLKLSQSAPGFAKIKGVAGCGKTTVLAKRAVNAHKRHNDKVIVFTYNKTLRNYIRDKISEVREDFSWGAFGITNYHAFIAQEMNHCGMEMAPPDDRRAASQYFDKLFSDEDLFEDFERQLYRYRTILLDEVQDYRPEWIKIIRKYFLSDDGEMVLFGDEGQNIYERNIGMTNSAIVQGFGRWERLKKSYRSKSDSQILKVANAFQNSYLLEKYDIDLVDIDPVQSSMSFDFFEGCLLSAPIDCTAIYNIIYSILRKYQIHPNDASIISSNIELLRKLDTTICTETKEKTQTTFETDDVYQTLVDRYKNDKNKLGKALDDIRGSKKFSFNLNSGLIKLSTVHSFKGLETSTSFFIILEEDADEMVYTGITRGRDNCFVLIVEPSRFVGFFRDACKVPLSGIEA
jgi:hypothetical protein